MDICDTDKKLCNYNEKILQYVLQLREQRDEGQTLMKKQLLEKEKLEAEMQKMAYRLSLLDKSIEQRTTALANYDSKIKDAEEKYAAILEKSMSLMHLVKSSLTELESIMDKRVGTGSEEENFLKEKAAMENVVLNELQI